MFKYFKKLENNNFLFKDFSYFFQNIQIMFKEYTVTSGTANIAYFKAIKLKIDNRNIKLKAWNLYISF